MRSGPILIAATFFAVTAMMPVGVAAQQAPEVAAPETHDTQINANRGAKRLVIQTDANAVNYSSTTAWLQVTAGSITIPGPQQGIIVGTFTAESNCSGTVGAWCSIRIICNGVELQPAVGTDFAYNSVGPTSSGSAWKSLSVTRRTNVLAGGAQTCEVQARSVGTATHRVDDWTFMLEYWRTS